ncbi:hypothetical protein GCM10022251_52450 [Phytohabitans flavus]|uniref:Polysaccharide chain length determinant N-terminal domain-containing protein n=1 Tax=Phytohabitans flavus TaxID=1076124 RepID=A0A6F8Y7Q4_9ACTN|nr:hypothetical protein [Phytohabitans flavus]BCB81991.1 hypothetical protein Pflav_084010 [Phytohabitans flavus]
MDLWDVTKVLWRHKWVALPLLVLTLVMAYFVSSSVKPDYKTTGHVTLLPPSTQKAVDPKKAPTTTTVSPWNVYSLADALVIYSARADIKRELSSEGLSEEWVASIGGTQLPIVEIEVVASSEQLAKATLARLIDALTAQLERLQSPYGVEGGEAITLEALDSGQNVQVVTSNVKRTLIVVTAIGLILTLSIVLLLDALLRRREVRKRAGSAGTSGSASVPARRYQPGQQPQSSETQIIPGKPVRVSKTARARAGVGWPEGEGTPSTNGNGSNGKSKGRVVQSKAAAPPPGRQQPNPGETGSGGGRRPTGDDDEQTIVISGIGNWNRRESGQQQPEDGDGKQSGSRHAPDSGSLPVAEDATTVLPLGRLRWVRPERDDGQRPPSPASPN